MPFDTIPKSVQGRAGKGKSLHIMIDFATALEKRLSTGSASSPIDDQLLDALSTHIRTLHLYCKKPTHSFSGNGELDKLGTSIWNLSTRLMRDTDGKATSTDGRKLAVYARTFSFHLISAAQNCGNANFRNQVRPIRLALKAVKSCIEASELEFAGFVLQKGAEYISNLAEHRDGLSNDDVVDLRGLEAEYYILRTALSWKEDRLDVAEQLYNKGHLSYQSLEPSSGEKLAEVLYEIGKDRLAKRDFQMAVKWLDRAQDLVNGFDLDQLSREALGLRSAIMQAYITALINLETSEGFAKADHMIEFMQSETGSTMLVLVLRLELLTKAPAEIFDSDAYARILSRLITCFSQKYLATDLAGDSPGDPDFRLIIHHIGKLYEKNPTLGCATLDEFILALCKMQHDERIERLVTKRIWMGTNRGESAEAVQATQAVLSHVRRPLSPDAAAAVQTLIWKTLESLYNQKLFDVAERWCKLALHGILENSGPLNRAKIERKYLLCAIAKNDIDGARSIFHSMAEETQKEPRTLYLMYKIAVRSNDREAATSCLDSISRVPQPLEYLYACCVDAQAPRNKGLAAEALRKLLEKNGHNPSSPVHLPALLRCTVRLMVRDYEDQRDENQRDEDENYNTVQNLCDVFNEVVAHIQHGPKDAKGNKLFDINELDWFARNAYNLGLKNLEAWDVSHTIQILTACTNIMNQFPDDVSSDIAADLSLKTLFNNFIIASALLAQARAQDNVEGRLQDYLLMGKHISAFDKDLPALLPALIGEARDDMLSKLAALLTFDFEGAVCLKSWDRLGEIVRKTADCKSVTALQAMADCLLRSDVPVQTIYSTLRQIIDQLWSLDALDVVKLARYMRCLFQVTLPFDGDLALGLAGEYCAIIRETAENKVPMPPEETEWLAATAFNHAVDCYFAQQDDLCKKWAFKAFDLAHLCANGGQLEEVLHEHYIKLKFDVK